ncbi:MAG: YaiI/YqxD family protein [Deltaproteobacteria bacterium]|nr:MAG: YaiI/YqxD family protein [Deltaproteobacteria bacterium]TNF30591.1 MAG: YaiI/YqxD family protein [Deltaproteobacteria bacterium]
MKIYIDADACPKPVKEAVFKAGSRLQIHVILVANSHMWIPSSPLISLVQVEKGADVADFYIVDHVEVGDLVITADIPLADLIVKKNVTAINPRGEVYTEENIGERLSMRDFMKELRDGGGLVTGGPAPYSDKDRINFTNSLNKILTKLAL